MNLLQRSKVGLTTNQTIQPFVPMKDTRVDQMVRLKKRLDLSQRKLWPRRRLVRGSVPIKRSLLFRGVKLPYWSKNNLVWNKIMHHQFCFYFVIALTLCQTNSALRVQCQYLDDFMDAPASRFTWGGSTSCLTRGAWAHVDWHLVDGLFGIQSLFRQLAKNSMTNAIG